MKKTKFLIYMFLFCFAFTNFSHAEVKTTPSTPVGVATPSKEGESLASTTRFVVPLNISKDKIIQNLIDSGFTIDKNLFTNATITPGAYSLSKNMTPTEIAKIINGKPYMVWIVIPPGLRKEEVANILAKNLNWSAKQKRNFLAYTNQTYNYLEGVYFPDTYLIPLNEDPKVTFNRFISKFNENFSVPQKEFAKQNFPWMKALTLASIVQREAANKEDMPLVAGILLNRIDQRIHLGVDATLQYVRGDKGKGFWAPITVLDKKTDSKYNTYKYYGLPPHPIASPSLDAIKAVLNPASTTCIYYLHDKNSFTHCSNSYEEHLQNIEIFLKASTTSTTSAGTRS